MNPKILKAQKIEITEYFFYTKIIKIVKNKEHQRVLSQMAELEKKHYEIWKRISQQSVKPSYAKIYVYYVITRLCGLSFGIKLLERGEKIAIKFYQNLQGEHPGLEQMVKEEQEHEKQLLSLINNKHLENAGSIILGLNDALVELTGALAGFTLALGNTHIIAMVGLITGIAASFSMAASSYLAAKENGQANAFHACIITGISYIITVTILVSPYFVFSNPFIALCATLFLAIFVIFIFNLYTAVAQNRSFKKKFLGMAAISLGTAILNFGIGYGVKKIFNV
jgi:VIT1/CCC1 family predicted Fe2+/Mn2+ transporter